MSKRIKKTTLFNKCHIILEKYENEENTVCGFKEEIKESGGGSRMVELNAGKVGKIAKLESRLGFYYYKKIKSNIQRVYADDYRKAVIYRFVYPDHSYYFSFLIQKCDTKADKEIHPWELEDPGMEDHFIFDLKDLIDTLFEEAKEFKLPGKSYKWFSGKNNIPDWEKEKKKLFVNLYGYEKGPIFQTNEQKIISHGFDPLTSFRKEKKEKPRKRGKYNREQQNS